ncbi:arginine repressor [Dysgonomonas macrotermitis]|uniref:Arginine repressor n=1 Tax=Dysgonomonas macrotermitis TaxID=1346286 RepID=A0A1M5AK10_9BACT|nr:ArgR family transcriptional regulator [Dysgonomonas macrotermitis]SHF30591.1 transcriptional regulator, ArgR family [Dysgonomonas macrotermitis]
MSKKSRHKIIKDIILSTDITSQDMLLNILTDKGFDVTQATLSRDIKEMKVVKAPTSKGGYAYQLSETFNTGLPVIEENTSLSAYGFVNIEFSGQLAVIKTRPGYAMAIAGEIDNKAARTILGTVAGDDTILLIPRENVNREDVVASLSVIIPNIQ